MPTQEDEPTGPEVELIRPEDFLPGNPYPPDARRLGVDQYSGTDAAWLAIANNLDSTKPTHRAIAIVLIVVFLLPFVFTILALLG